MLLDAYAVGYIERLMAAVDGRSRVAFLFSIIPVGAVTVKYQVQLPCLQLGLLQAEEVGVQLLENVTKSFANHGPQAVHVP